MTTPSPGVAPRQTDDVLEVAADACARAFAPHVCSLSRAEILAPYEAHSLSVEACEVVQMPVYLNAWMQHTDTPPAAQSLIRSRMEEEFYSDKVNIIK